MAQKILEKSVITAEFRSGFYRKANKYYSQNFVNKISVTFEAVWRVTISITLCHT